MIDMPSLSLISEFFSVISKCAFRLYRTIHDLMQTDCCSFPNTSTDITIDTSRDNYQNIYVPRNIAGFLSASWNSQVTFKWNSKTMLQPNDFLRIANELLLQAIHGCKWVSNTKLWRHQWRWPSVTSKSLTLGSTADQWSQIRFLMYNQKFLMLIFTFL